MCVFQRLICVCGHTLVIDLTGRIGWSWASCCRFGQCLLVWAWSPKAKQWVHTRLRSSGHVRRCRSSRKLWLVWPLMPDFSQKEQRINGGLCGNSSAGFLCPPSRGLRSIPNSAQIEVELEKHYMLWIDIYIYFYYSCWKKFY